MRAVILGFLFAAVSSLGGFTQEAGPDVTAIVQALEAFDSNPNKKTREALDAALEAYSDEPTQESLEAVLARVKADAQKRSFKNLRISSQAALTHMEPVADVIPRQYLNMKMVSAIALFNHKPKKEALIEMVEAEAAVHSIYHQQGENLEDWVSPMQHEAQAWTLAMTAYFDSARKRRPTDEELDVLRNQLHLPGYHEADEADQENVSAGNKLPFCKGKYSEKPRLRYPSGASSKGKFGSVIVSVDIGETGKFENVEVLAAVPNKGFKTKATETISQWSWIVEEDQIPSENCKLEAQGVVIPLVFKLEQRSSIK